MTAPRIGLGMALDFFWQGRYALGLLLEKRFWLFALADSFLLLIALLRILGDGAQGGDIYQLAVVLPYLLLTLPALSTVVDLERQAGSLDLALAVPSTERYFLRRASVVAFFFLFQGWLILGTTMEDPGDRLRSLLQSSVVMALLVALVLFWSVRLRTSGAVLTASWISVAVLSKWIFYNPTISKSGGPPEKVLGIALPVLEWSWNLLVLAFATFIFYQYARERLRRPETLL